MATFWFSYLLTSAHTFDPVHSCFGLVVALNDFRFLANTVYCWLKLCLFRLVYKATWFFCWSKQNIEVPTSWFPGFLIVGGITGLFRHNAPTIVKFYRGANSSEASDTLVNQLSMVRFLLFHIWAEKVLLQKTVFVAHSEDPCFFKNMAWHWACILFLHHKSLLFSFHI